MRTFIIIISIIVLFIIGSCTSQSGVYTKESPELDKFAKCLKDSGVKMYGSLTCAVCKRQRALFGSSFEFVGEIECHPRGKNPQTELCLQKDIEKTPTWTLEMDGKELNRREGFMNIEDLEEFSGCSLEVNG